MNTTRIWEEASHSLDVVILGYIIHAFNGLPRDRRNALATALLNADLSMCGPVMNSVYALFLNASKCDQVAFLNQFLYGKEPPLYTHWEVSSGRMDEQKTFCVKYVREALTQDANGYLVRKLTVETNVPYRLEY